MSTQNIPAMEFVESLTGFDEIAIAKWFNAEWMELGNASQVRFTRALIFVDMRRKGSNDPDAYEAAHNLTVKEVMEFFPDDEENDFDEDSDSGKDSSD